MKRDLLGGARKYMTEDSSTPHSAGSFKCEDFPMKFEKPGEWTKPLGRNDHRH
jgi:hypothetical protein